VPVTVGHNSPLPAFFFSFTPNPSPKKPKNLKPYTLFFFFSTNSWYIDTYPENLFLEAMQVLLEPGFQDLYFRTWINGSQDLGFRTQTDARNASYGRLIFFPSPFSASIVTFLFPVTFLCVQWSQTDRRTQSKKPEEGEASTFALSWRKPVRPSGPILP
jgi:hypothetical protein